MSNPYIGWVNLQMVSVRHHLALLLEETNANDRIRNRGVLESCAWHLKRAYVYYLCELGANYQLKSPEKNNSADDLARALESVGKHPGEAAELSKLEHDGWISDLFSTLASSEAPGTSVQKTVGTLSPDTGISNSGLQLVDLDQTIVPLTAESLTEWLGKFKELIDRHREVMIEY